MANIQKIGTHKTKIRTENNNTIVRYHDTDVVTFNNKVVYLNTNGYKTNTTKVRINQTANEYNLWFKLYQKNYTWFVEIFSQGSHLINKPVTLKFDGNDIGFWNPNYMSNSEPLAFQSELIENNTKLGNKLNPKEFLALLKV